MGPLPDPTMARLQVEISDDLKRQLKIEAVKTGQTMAELCEAAIAQYLSQSQQTAKK